MKSDGSFSKLKFNDAEVGQFNAAEVGDFYR